MTAMMAFFLVMWLVNAANEETKASVASYFNPIQLSDEKPTSKGLKKPVDEKDGEEQKERSKVKAEEVTVGSAAATGEDLTSQTGEEANYSEADFFDNPYSVLAEIAQEVGQQANVSAKGEGGAAQSGPATGASGGEAYRDPFDPDFWTQQVKVTRTDQQSPSVPVGTTEEDTKAETAKSTPPSDLVSEVANLKVQENTSENAPEVAMVTPTKRPDNVNEIASPDETVTPLQKKKADDLRKEIQKEISGVSGKLAEGLVVTPAEGGVLVTISDQSETPMFNVGSAVPRKEMVLAMEKIGKLLQDKGGSVIIRGHTDGRQFKGSSNDNWRLSMDRAHSAYYMLVRGGLTEDRVKQVSGFADRRLQVPTDPLANSNRRIEILLGESEG
jgi:chemotaxis protein MotB